MVAGVKEAVQLPLSSMDKSRLKQFPSRALVTLSLLFLGGGKASSA